MTNKMGSPINLLKSITYDQDISVNIRRVQRSLFGISNESVEESYNQISDMMDQYYITESFNQNLIKNIADKLIKYDGISLNELIKRSPDIKRILKPLEPLTKKVSNLNRSLQNKIIEFTTTRTELKESDVTKLVSTTQNLLSTQFSIFKKELKHVLTPISWTLVYSHLVQETSRGGVLSYISIWNKIRDWIYDVERKVIALSTHPLKEIKNYYVVLIILLRVIAVVSLIGFTVSNPIVAWTVLISSTLITMIIIMFMPILKENV